MDKFKLRVGSGRKAGRSVYGRARQALSQADEAVGHLLDIAEIEEGSEIDRKVQAAMYDLYEALYDLPKNTRYADRIAETGPLVFPLPNRDMRFWRMSDQRRASALLTGRRAGRVASAVQVLPSPTLTRYRPMTASEYLRAFDAAVITDRSAEPAGYTRSRVCL